MLIMVIKMIKKIFITLIVAVTLGSVMGIFLHDKFNSEVLALGKSEKLIFLREGVYTSKEVMEENTKKIDPKLVVFDDGKYYVYVGITGNKKIASKIKKIYDDMDMEVYEKEISVDNETFIKNVYEFDSLMLSSNMQEIMTVEEVILANYEEVFGNGA